MTKNNKINYLIVDIETIREYSNIKLDKISYPNNIIDYLIIDKTGSYLNLVPQGTTEDKAIEIFNTLLISNQINKDNNIVIDIDKDNRIVIDINNLLNKESVK